MSVVVRSGARQLFGAKGRFVRPLKLVGFCP
jgi:hypothetical protein